MVQGIQQFEKYKILMDEAKANGNKARVAKLEKLLKSIDLKKISKESANMVNGFGNGLNKM